MEIKNKLLTGEEKISFRLRSLYAGFGYSCFKMSKFEEYDLYSRNKDFLVSDRVLTFTDTDGKLMALKPDVTLSIVKNYDGTAGDVQRVYYNENVYRVSENTKKYKEIMQAGLECIGALTDYNLFEVLFLAAESLNVISERSVLILSHLGVISAILEKVGCAEDELLLNISEKNLHGVDEICKRCAIDGSIYEILKLVTASSWEADDILQKLRKLSSDKLLLKSLDEIERAARFLKSNSKVPVRVDFSVVNDMNYYNGLVFRGYVKEIPARVLSGGQYDKLMDKMSKNAKAAGFAVYLDLAERLKTEDYPDVDAVLLYDENIDAEDIIKEVKKYREAGKSVAVCADVPNKITFGEIIRISEKKLS